MRRLKAQRGRPPAVVLASGDPLWFGIGRLLLERFQPRELRFHPHLSAFQLAASRLAWPLAETACLTLHGRALERLNRHLAHGRRLLILTSDGEAPALIGGHLARAGFGRSTLTVLENLGGGETRTSFEASAAAHRRFGDLNTLAVMLKADDGAGQGITQGLPDTAFLNDGQLTKQEVRAVTLARLAPGPASISGTSAPVPARSPSNGCSPAEHPRTCRPPPPPSRPRPIASPSSSRTPTGWASRSSGSSRAGHRRSSPTARPRRRLHRGGLGTPMLIETCLKQLRPGGRLVCNAVTLGGEARLLDLQKRHGRRALAHRHQPCRAHGPHRGMEGHGPGHPMDADHGPGGSAMSQGRLIGVGVGRAILAS
jgi:precorrin-6Y C5,15-methyltransferase (decarboxylating)